MRQRLLKRILCCLLAAGMLPLFSACGAFETDGAAAKGGLIVNEVVSSNKRSLVDSAVGSPDWVELYNGTSAAVDLGGYGLSDNLRNLHKYVFPAGTVIEAQSYLVVYCGDNNGVTKTDVPCTGFGLSKSGDYLFLTDAYYGVIEQLEIPELMTDVSYARKRDGSFGYCATPTPGAANTEPILGTLDALFDEKNAAALTISEVLPRETKDGAPWVELHNTSDKAIQLSEYYLSDSEANVMRWQGADVAIPAGGYACVYLSGLGTKAASGVHTDFKLGKSDTCVILSDLSGNVIDEITWAEDIEAGIAVVKTAEGTAYTAFPTFEQANSADTFTELGMREMEPSDPVHINEVLKKNTLSAIDRDGDRSEWVELVNRSSNTVSLHGYFLSDDETDLYKWALPDVNLGAGAYQLVFLSGKDRTEGELHASFRLGADETALFLTTVDGMKTERIDLSALVRSDVSAGYDSGGSLRYYAQPTPGAKNAQGFETAEEIGCFNKNGVFISEVSAVPAPKSGDNDWIELYNGADAEVDLTGWYLSDDPDEPEKWRFPLTVLPAGKYLVVETTTHTARQTASVATFGIGPGGDTLVLSDTKGNLVDTFATGALSEGMTSGRIERDNTTARVFFDDPTPGEKNSDEIYIGYAPEPTLSETGLYHSEAFAVTVACRDINAVVRYTTDGSEPTYRSAQYTEPVTIKKNTVFRAASFVDGLLRSTVATATYLFDEPHTVPVVCVNGDPLRVREVMKVDDKDEKVEREALISYYETDGTLGVTFPAGIKPKGAGTVAYSQKSLSINLRAGYGQSSVTYPFFPDYDFTTFSALVVRNGGQDWSTARMRDSYCQRLVMGMHVDCSATRPVVVYVNGAYNGLYDLGEDQNSEYLVTHYGVDGDAVDVIRRNSTTIAGDNKDIKYVRQYALDTDLSDDAEFAKFSEMIDVEFFTDYFIAQTYFCNSDMFNQKYWRSQDNAVKWRPIFYDLDFGFKNSVSRDILRQYFNIEGVPSADGSLTYFEIYIGLKKNEGWKKYCFERYVEVVETYFNSDRATKILDEMAAALRPEMARQIAKWGKPGSVREWEQNVAALRKIAEERPDYALDQICRYFGFNDAYLAELRAKYKAA